jgi:hypothetical protein
LITLKQSKYTFKSLPGNVWQVPAYNKHANLWIAKVSGTVKTLAEAQAIVDAEVTAAQTAWDALSDEDKVDNPRPADITLTE